MNVVWPGVFNMCLLSIATIEIVLFTYKNPWKTHYSPEFCYVQFSAKSLRQNLTDRYQAVMGTCCPSYLYLVGPKRTGSYPQSEFKLFLLPCAKDRILFMNF